MAREKGRAVFYCAKRNFCPGRCRSFFLFCWRPLLCPGIFITKSKKKSVIHEQISQLQAIADLKAIEAKNWLGERRSDAQAIVQNTIIMAELLVLPYGTGSWE